jgi:signal-transduction protein with cAMP-binding, CBS, and nucleotidyltransferase domain
MGSSVFTLCPWRFQPDRRADPDHFHELVGIKENSMSDMVHKALVQMRDNRVRSVLVIDDGTLVGIVTQGDCAIKVLLPGLDAKETAVSQVMTRNPITVKLDDTVEGCMGLMVKKGFRHLPVLDQGKVVGVISIGDAVKDIIHDLKLNVGDLMGYIMTDGPGG